jgi:hypothetical protein
VSGARAAFLAIAERLLSEPGIEEGTGFGSGPGLRVGGRIFAILRGDELVLKLPARRCAELVASGAALPFDRGQGRPLKEWVVVGADECQSWSELADEALSFVGR